MMKNHNNGHVFYKPLKKGNGGALSIRYAEKLNSLFFDFGKQKGERAFDWDNKIVMKIDIPDIGVILRALREKEDEIKIYHKNDAKGTVSGLKITKIKDNNYFGFSFNVFRKLKDGQSTEVFIPISPGEAEIIIVLLEWFVKLYSNFLFGYFNFIKQEENAK